MKVTGDDELSRAGKSRNKAAESQQHRVAAIADNAQMLAHRASSLEGLAGAFRF